LNNRQKKIVAHIIREGFVTSGWCVKKLKVVQNTAYRLKEKRAGYGEEIVHALSRQLSWTHFRSIIYLDDPLKRDFYAEMCRIEQWSTRTMEKKIEGYLQRERSRSGDFA